MYIEVDFEVYKVLFNRFEDELDTMNAVLRRELGLGAEAVPSLKVGGPVPLAQWFGLGVQVPIGTELQATYKKQSYTGKVVESGLEVDGKCYSSLSTAASAITEGNINGWNFWKFKDERSGNWKPMSSKR